MFNARVFVLVIMMPMLVTLNAGDFPNKKDNAVVTLVMGEKSGYSAGAIALGQSLKDVGSKLSRVCLVTPDVEEFNRKALSKLWKVVEVEPIYCNHKLDPSVNEHEYDLKGEQYIAGITRWSTTCTKFAAWKLTQFKRVVFFDSDVVVLQPIDDVLYGFSNASFAAAPETFPPDTFNSGAMVFDPSLEIFEKLLQLNEEVGSAEGGDQGVFNNGLCPNWYTVRPDDPHCGKIPWMFNVEAANFAQYQTLRKMSGQRLPAVAHFVSDGKPWKVIAMEYLGMDISPETRTELMKQKFLHLYWRLCFFKASKDTPPSKSFFGEDADALFHKPWTGDESSRSNLIEELGLLDSYRENTKTGVTGASGRSGRGRANNRGQSQTQQRQRAQYDDVDSQEEEMYESPPTYRGKMSKRRRKPLVVEEVISMESRENENLEAPRSQRGPKAKGKSRRGKKNKTSREI